MDLLIKKVIFSRITSHDSLQEQFEVRVQDAVVAGYWMVSQQIAFC
jgi:hypothetical protein